MDTAVNGVKSYPLQMAQDMEQFVRRVAKAQLTTTTEAELDAIHVRAKFLEWRLDGRA